MEVVISLKQHVGAPCEPVVKVGDYVKKGQLIAKPSSLGANIHSSVYGKVTKLDDAITILADEEQPDDFVKIPDTKDNLDAIKEAGVVGAGGAGFPTDVKLFTKIEGGYLIVNAAECEPLLSHNIEFIKKEPDVIARGIDYLMDIVSASKGYIAIKAKHREAILKLNEEIKNKKNIELRFLPNIYPAGDERVIVRELLGEIIQPGELPSKYNAVIVNVETLKNCVMAIEKRRPVITKDLTVAGKVKAENKVFLDQPIGMPITHYIDEAGGYLQGNGEIVIGGPFTGKRGGENFHITKLSGGVLFAVEFPREESDFGILACECGADEQRLTEIVESMGGKVVSSIRCKRMIEVNGRFRCEKPGECPGQTESVMKLKQGGAKVIIAGT